MPDDPTAVRRSTFTTGDPDLAEHAIRSAYVENNLVLDGDRDGFSFGHWTVDTPRFSVNRLRADVDMIVDAESAPEDPLLVISPVNGRLAYVDSGYDDTYVAAATPVLVPPQHRMRALCEGLDEILVPLNRDEVAAHAAATTGIDADDLVFHSLSPISPARARYWNTTVTHIRDDLLDDSWASTQPIAMDQAFRTLAGALLTTFPNTALDRSAGPADRPARDDVSAAVLDEVVDYLDAHADRPIGATDLARLAGAPTSALRAGLRRRYGKHPAELLWKARLRGLRRDLLHADPASGTAVDDLAARWGFARRTRYRVAYAREFAEWPEETLQRR